MVTRTDGTDEAQQPLLRSFLQDAAIAAAPEVVAAAVPVLAELREFIKDSGGCDHSVGICMCEVIRKADELDAALAKVRP